MKMLVLKDLHNRIARLDAASSTAVLDALDMIRSAPSIAELLAHGNARSIGEKNYLVNVGNWRVDFKVVHRPNGEDEAAVVAIDRKTVGLGTAVID